MVPIWLNRKTTPPVSEQLAAQILLSIFSGTILPGERLPSVRAFARRLGIHPNTVSHSYRSLAAGGWVETKRGKGAYAAKRPPSAGVTLDDCARAGLHRAAELGFTADDLIAALQRLSAASTKRLVVTDPDGELARILAHEIGEALGCLVPTRPWAADSCIGEAEADRLTVITARRQEDFERQQPGRPFEAIQIRSIPEMLAGAPTVAEGSLVAFVSRSPVLRRWASVLAAAFGLGSHSILFRNPAQPRWQAGLKACSFVAADLVAASEWETPSKHFLVRLVAPASLAALVRRQSRQNEKALR